MFYLKHGLGPMWSLSLKGCDLDDFKNVLNETIAVETTKDGVTFSV